MIYDPLGPCPVSLEPCSLCQCGLCGWEGRNQHAQDLLCSGPHLTCLENVQPQAAFSCAQQVPWVCGKAARVALPGTQNHRIPAWQGLEGTSGDLLVQPPYQSRVIYGRLHSTTSRWVLNISREGESTTPLGNLFQGSITLKVKKFFLVFRRNFLGFILCPLPLVLSLGTTEKGLAPSS